MHGRVKVRTSEEEKVRKDKERQEKLKIYKHAMQKIHQKRKDRELDQELLDITGNVLTANPDIYTLWNIRREIINVFRETGRNGEDLSKILDDELKLTEYCLKINPKSYCAWHQREWVLTTRPDPDWQKELDLCTNYLKLDERNFHTWDYRRFVVKQCKPSLEEEFKYTTEKLHSNFSNYSAWHYRSKMLVELYPDLKGGRPIMDSHHKHELKMVQSAAFTDPDDTSAWFYQRWLLGAVKTSIQLVVCTMSKTKTTVAYSQYVSRDFIQSTTRVLINNAHLKGVWKSCTGNEYDVIWILKHDDDVKEDLDVKVEYAIDNDIESIVCKQYKPNVYVGKNQVTFQKKYADPVIAELKDQLESCRQLLALEPESKWTMFTTTVFLYCIDAKLYHNEIINNLNELKKIDKLRAGYYDDCISKWSIEQEVPKLFEKVDLSFKTTFPDKMTSLPHLQYFSYCEEVDLSNHELTSNNLASLMVLQHCKLPPVRKDLREEELARNFTKLSLAHNKITSLEKFPMLHLEELDLRGNPIITKDLEKLKNQIEINILF